MARRVPRKVEPAMEHLNGALLCAIAIETTGQDPFYHDVAQIAVVPVNYEIKRMKSVELFYADIRPRYMDRIDQEKMSLPLEKMREISAHGLDAAVAEQMLERWFDDLELDNNKKIMPLAYNWPYIQPFIQRWLGTNTFNYVFDYRPRDVLSMALYIQDYYWHHVESYPYQKVDFPYLCSESKVKREHGKYKDTMTECVALIDLYRDMCLGRIRLGMESKS